MPFILRILSIIHKLYALGLGGLTITVDCKSLHITEVAASVLDRDRGLKYLVKSFDDLLLLFLNSTG